MKKRLRPGIEALWEAVDQAIWGEGTTRAERARMFGQLMEEGARRGLLRDPFAETTLGERLKALRLEQGLTPSRASRRAGVEGSAWRSWEACHRIPTVAELRRVADLVGPKRWRELSRLRHRAPEVCLTRTLLAPSPFRVARAVDHATDAQEAAVLEIRNLDPHLRRALEAWCQRTSGGCSEADLVAALEEARGKSETQKQEWVRTVCAGVTLEEDPA